MSAEKKKRFSIKKLIYNDKYLIIISIITALVIWFTTSMNLSPETTKTVTVTLGVDFSGSVSEELGIMCYGDESINVDVTVSAKKYLIKDIVAEDFTTTLQMNSVSTTGQHEIPIIVSTAENTDFTIKSYYPSTYSAYFDVPEEKEMEINLNYKSDVLFAEGYVGGEAIISQPSVVVSGPKAYMQRIAKITADVVVEDNLSKTATIDVTPKALDAYGAQVEYIKFNDLPEKLTVTIPAYKEVNLPVSASLVNPPEKSDAKSIKIAYSKNKIRAGVLESANIKTANLGEISYSKLGVGDNEFTFDLTELDGVMVLDGTKSITITITVPSTYTDKNIKISASNIEFRNIPEGYKAHVTSLSASSVTVVGVKSDIEDLTSSNLTLSCDLSAAKGEKINTGSNEYTVNILTKGVNAWAYGTYKATVNITKE